MIVSPHAVPYGRRMVTTHKFTPHLMTGGNGETTSNIAWYDSLDHRAVFPWDFRAVVPIPESVFLKGMSYHRTYTGSVDFDGGFPAWTTELWTIDQDGEELDRICFFGSVPGSTSPPLYDGIGEIGHGRASGLRWKIVAAEDDDDDSDDAEEEFSASFSVELGQPCIILWDYLYPYPFRMPSAIVIGD